MSTPGNLTPSFSENYLVVVVSSYDGLENNFGIKHILENICWGDVR